MCGVCDVLVVVREPCCTPSGATRPPTAIMVASDVLDTLVTPVHKTTLESEPPCGESTLLLRSRPAPRHIQVVVKSFFLVSSMFDICALPQSAVGLYKLAIIATIRTALAYFLGKELAEAKEELEEYDEVKITV